MKKRVHYLYLLLALSLLPGRLDAAPPTTSFTISSLYGLNFGTVTVSDVTAPGNLPPYTCDFSKSPQCVIPNVTRGDALHLALKANNAFIVSSSTGNCAGFPSDTTQFKVPASGDMACGIFGGYPLTIQAAGAAKLGISDMAVGGKAIPVGPTCQPGGEASCQVAVAPGTLTLTVGLQQGQVIAGGAGLCSKATAAPFEITLPATGPYFCAINTGVPSTPASGWWWTQKTPDTGIRYALEFSPDLSSLYGVAATFRDDGSPVWYVINANNAADADAGSGKAAPPSGATSTGAAGSSATKANGTGSAGWAFAGSASEYVGGGGLTDGPESDSSGLQTIVADIDLSFPAVGPATLTWAPRDGSPTVVKILTRFPIGSTVQPPPAYAPAPGFYVPAQGAGVSYFMEMQGSAEGTPHAYAGAFSYDTKGRATWSTTDTLGTHLLTPYPSVAAQKGWKLSTRLLTSSGGSPITAASPKQPKQVPGYPIVAQLMASNGPANASAANAANNTASAAANNMVQVANAKPASLAPRSQAGTPPTAYVLHFANMAKNFTPYVTLASPGTNGAGYFWYMAKGKPTKLRGYSSVAVSSLPGGSLNATSTLLGIGPLYISDNRLMQGSPCSPWKPAPAPTPPAPSATNPSDCNYNTRWQYVELTGNYDITYINLFSFPLVLSQGKAFAKGSKNYGYMSLPTTLLLEQKLAALGGAAAVYPKGSQGTKTFIRIVSPVDAGSPTDPLILPYVPSISSYITQAFRGPSGVANPSINIKNQYNGAAPSGTSVCKRPAVGPKPAFLQQTYQTTSIAYTGGVLTIKGTGTGSSAVGNFTITAKLTPAEFALAIYQSTIQYSVANQYCTSGATETNGANDVFSAVVRDLLVGFSAGLVDSKTPAPANLNPATPAAKTYGAMTSLQWSNSAAKLYAGLQPSPSKNYNLWAAAITGVLANQVYSSQYTDFFLASGPLGTPQLTPVNNIPMQITILDNRPLPK